MLNDTKDQVLLGLSSHTQEYWLPGGSINEDEHPVDALFREIEEECNISNMEKVEHLGSYQDQDVFLGQVSDSFSIQPSFDPDSEFVVLQWFPLVNLPSNLSELSSDILYKHLNDGEFEKKEVLSQKVESVPEQFKIRKLGNKIKVASPFFDALINPPTKTAKILSNGIGSNDKLYGREIFDWFEKTAKEMGCLRVMYEIKPEDPLGEEFAQELGYKLQPGAGVVTTYKKVLAFSSPEEVRAGTIEILVDGVKKFTISDDEIWQTMPGLAQERAKGKKITMCQVLDDGTIIDF